MSKLSEILEIIEAHGEWLHGGDVSRTVDEWLATGLQVDVIVDYVEAGCFDAKCAKRLHDVGVYGDDLTNLVCEDYRVAVGYAFANGDITLDAVLTRYIQSIGEWAQHNGPIN